MQEQLQEALAYSKGRVDALTHRKQKRSRRVFRMRNVWIAVGFAVVGAVAKSLLERRRAQPSADQVRDFTPASKVPGARDVEPNEDRHRDMPAAMAGGRSNGS